MLERTRDNEIHVELVEEPPAKSIAFGLERLGLIPMKALLEEALQCGCLTLDACARALAAHTCRY